jgi:hypothetical protein
MADTSTRGSTLVATYLASIGSIASGLDILCISHQYACDKLAFWNPHTMNDLALIIPEQLPGALTTAEIDATMAYAEAEKALATRAAYASDWRDFAAWCASRGATALPAHQGIVAAYLSNLADSGRKASTIGPAVLSAIESRSRRRG